MRVMIKFTFPVDTGNDAIRDGGYLTLSDRPGIGFEGQSALYSIMHTLAA